jgi:hypothetical protein
MDVLLWGASLGKDRAPERPQRGQNGGDKGKEAVNH